MSGPSPISHFPVSKSVYEFVQGITEKIAPPDYCFFCHILASTFIKLKQPLKERKFEVWVSVSSTLFDGSKGCQDRISPKDLVCLGLIGSCSGSLEQSWTNYKISDWILDQVTPLLDVDDKEVDLFTGKPVKRASVSVKKNEKGVLEPPLIRDAIDAITECRFNWAAIKAVIRGRKAEMEVAKHTGDYRNYQGKYLNDYYCFKAVRRQQPVYLEHGIFWYRPPYRTQKTGCISHLWGGLQSCSPEMKHAAYIGIPNCYYYNLRSSPSFTLKQQYEAVGLNTSWLETFLQDREVRKTYAEALGISVDDFQQAFNAAMVGSYFETEFDDSVYRILSWTYPERADTHAALDQFLTAIAPMQLSRWHQLLEDEYYTFTGYKQKGKRYLHNPTGKTICVDNIQQVDRPRELAGFVLQGQEAAFNHWICILGLKYGYQVMSHQHTGVVTLGEISQAAIDEAQAESGLQYAFLEEKPILQDLTKVNEWLKRYGG